MHWFEWPFCLKDNLSEMISIIHSLSEIVLICTWFLSWIETGGSEKDRCMININGLMWIRSIGYNGHLSLVVPLLIAVCYAWTEFCLIEMVSRDNLCTITVAVQSIRFEPHPQNYAFYQRLHLIEHDFFFSQVSVRLQEWMAFDAQHRPTTNNSHFCCLEYKFITICRLIGWFVRRLQYLHK